MRKKVLAIAITLCILLLFCSCEKANVNTSPSSTPTPTKEEIVFGEFPKLEFEDSGDILNVKYLIVNNDYTVTLRSDNNYFFNAKTKEYNFDSAFVGVRKSIEEFAAENYDSDYMTSMISNGYKVFGILVYFNSPYFVLEKNGEQIVSHIGQTSLQYSYAEFCEKIENYYVKLDPKPTGGPGLY